MTIPTSAPAGLFVTLNGANDSAVSAVVGAEMSEIDPGLKNPIPSGMVSVSYAHVSVATENRCVVPSLSGVSVKNAGAVAASFASCNPRST